MLIDAAPLRQSSQSDANNAADHRAVEVHRTTMARLVLTPCANCDRGWNGQRMYHRGKRVLLLKGPHQRWMRASVRWSPLRTGKQRDIPMRRDRLMYAAS
jgi:hypothetical protein